MKHFIHAVTVFSAFTFSQTALLSCQNQDEASIIAEPETVNVTFSDVTFTFEEDKQPTRGVNVGSESAGVNRISLSVYDSRNNLKFSSQKSSVDDAEDFDKISCKLLPGAYTFVAVAHKASADSEEAATITSQSKATITTEKVSGTYKAIQPVTVVQDGSNNVTIAFGQRITSTFQLKIADETPAEVTKCEIILNPSASQTTTYNIDLTTGFTDKVYRNSTIIKRSDLKEQTFTGVYLGPQCFLTGNSQNITAKINMLNESDEVLYTRTISNIPMQPHGRTVATGDFFDVSVTGGFTFNTTDEISSTIEF